MPNLEKVIKGLEWILENDRFGFGTNWTPESETYDDYEQAGYNIQRAIDLLKEQEVEELTLEEWRKWKSNQKRDPICMLWKNDTSPMWTLNPNDVHEPALLMGELKLFNGKPTFKQCKAVKW